MKIERHDRSCNRRGFLRRLGALSGMAAGSLVLPALVRGRASPTAASAGTPASASKERSREPSVNSSHARECMFYKKHPEMEVECEICPRKCRVGDIERGYCGTRENRNGVYYSLAYALPCAIHVDPIEKKPLFHFHPGTNAFSLGTAGCNMDCKFCQNWEMSQARPEQTSNVHLPPKETVEKARQASCASVAFTYSEPGVVAYEYMLDTAIEGKKSGIKTVMISNGYINREPMLEAAKHLGAVKIDLKAFTEKYYAEICDATLKPVLDTLVLLKSSGVWCEIVYLVLPTLNDGDSEIVSASKWIAQELGPDVPLHFTRFYPIYKMTKLPQTPISALEKARKIAMNAGLHYVYIGNVPGHEGENTYCPSCKKAVVKRIGYSIVERKLSEGRCAYCKAKIAGVWG
ncbi:MAG: AmmeMemoRadiSam system radical SAM enzyme [Candidatus Eisenbacteria bacterium]|nr:AmmeMemoRadiSam system radical SAM enzyme [Candidatus Eisenbacteria bacterium]